MGLQRTGIITVSLIIFYLGGAYFTRGHVINQYLYGNPISFPDYFPRLIAISNVVNISLLVLLPFCVLAKRWAFLAAMCFILVDAVAEFFAAIETWSLAGAMSPAFIGLIALLVAAVFCWATYRELGQRQPPQSSVAP